MKTKKAHDHAHSVESNVRHYARRLDSIAASAAESIVLLAHHLERIAPDIRRAVCGVGSPVESLTESFLRRVDSLRCEETNPPSIAEDLRRAIEARNLERGKEVRR
jgi:hypothetical protein